MKQGTRGDLFKRAVLPEPSHKLETNEDEAAFDRPLKKVAEASKEPKSGAKKD